VAESLRHWSTNFLAEPHDHRYIATPCAFPAGSPVLDSWIASLTLFLGKEPLAYTTAMHFLKSAVQSGGAERAIAPLSAVSPISRLAREQCLKAQHVGKFNLPEIFSRLPFLRGPDVTSGHEGWAFPRWAGKGLRCWLRAGPIPLPPGTQLNRSDIGKGF